MIKKEKHYQYTDYINSRFIKSISKSNLAPFYHIRFYDENLHRFDKIYKWKWLRDFMFFYYTKTI